MKNILLLLLFPFLSFGQGWVQTYESGIGNSVKETSDGGFIIAGNLGFFDGSVSSILIKVDSNGGEEWSNIEEGQSSDDPCCWTQSYRSQSVIETNSGYISTTNSSWSGFDSWGGGSYVRQVDFLGENGWVAYSPSGYEPWPGGGNSYTSHSILTTNNDCVSVGSYATMLEAQWPLVSFVFLQNINPNNGLINWSQTYENLGGEMVAQTIDGGYIIAGAGLIKTDAAGNEEWSNNDISAKAIKQTNDGGFVVSNNENITKFDLNWNIEWEKDWNNIFNIPINQLNGHTSSNNIIITDDNNYVTTGTINNNGQYIYLICFDSDGSVDWMQTFGGFNLSGIGNDVQKTIDGGYVITGSLNDSICLIKTDSEGNINTTSIIETPSINKTLITTVDILGRETNNNEGLQLHIYNDGTVEKKYLIK